LLPLIATEDDAVLETAVTSVSGPWAIGRGRGFNVIARPYGGKTLKIGLRKILNAERKSSSNLQP
jgi:hypothetical protein